MQGPQAARLNVCAALLAGSVEPLIEALQSRVDRDHLGLRGIVDRLQGFIILQPNREVTVYQGVAPLEVIAPAGQPPPDFAEILKLS